MNTKIKQLNFDGKVLYYELERQYITLTHFYKTTVTVPAFKILGFTIQKEMIVGGGKLFTIHGNIESPLRSKLEVRKLIQDQFDILERRSEIEAGIII